MIGDGFPCISKRAMLSQFSLHSLPLELCDTCMERYTCNPILFNYIINKQKNLIVHSHLEL